ncbi:hypothetical protein [Endozoicomonas sp. ONNA2]|uniref:hypothetical protein n=1 Tax=Endozoicomonas sp. ONNA2 TaxID=2828741 RepID=UPI0021473006|nr:hypothetical protein [Endozoicomonas sp. ONNA2]
MVCSISLSVHEDNDKERALMLYPQGNPQARPISVIVDFPEHDMMSEEAMVSMMESMAHTMAEEYRQHLKQKTASNEEIARQVVGDFFKRARQG